MIRPYLPGVINTSAPVFHATLIPISIMPIGLARVRLNLFAIHLNGLNMFLTSCGEYRIQTGDSAVQEQRDLTSPIPRSDVLCGDSSRKE